MVFQHVAAEPLGTLDALIRARGHRIRFHNFQRHPDAQPNIDRYRGLIVLGGPMNFKDQHRCPHLTTELKAIESALRQDKPVLGILGQRSPVFLWHGYTCDLPSGAVQLAHR
jgi:GMP synthase (glutamine-hydrolysing)